MRISVFGLGYVGTVSAACLARDGHHVIGVDTNSAKVDILNSGQSPIVEPGLEEMIRSTVDSGQLFATLDARKAILDTELSIVCVGTPSRRNGSLEIKYVQSVCAEIGTALADKIGFHTVVIRSTMLPGTMNQVVIPEIERTSGLQAGAGFGICFNPEFLRESTAIYDYDNPPKIVIGSSDAVTAGRVAGVFEHLPAKLIQTSIEVAEAVKYTDNVWHAVKVDFANEIGTLCEAVGVDGQEVMDIFLQDRKLNISPNYLRPGLAFGGSCLPKDVRAITYLARIRGLRLPLLEHVLPSNEEQVQRAIERIEDCKERKIGVLGVSFKAKTDDLRESPMLRIVEQLHGRGYSVLIYDPTVSRSILMGENKRYIMELLPHIYEMLTEDHQAVLDHAKTLVIGNRDERYRDLLQDAQPHHHIIDLVGLGVTAQEPAQVAAD